ncbi:hypothetical protein RB614_37480 [Phytohabitans sp. ZYX-F-186]|uniref:TetR family transcriptional regulator n=1 Tax=Phytohabitans maris TaxID=3071409 RepID=A0ABU0ZT40_9ACTN|nr:hypothetical protein [Phytohabitans sp. ZYX-F-186]MDQ7910203.1 hypothetical protein [Phytohabitans sp. ZYX-F-186]
MTALSDRRKFKDLAAKLHDAAAARGLILYDGAAEAFLAERIRQVATALGISQHQALLRGFDDDDVVPSLVGVLADGYARLDAVYDNASPILLPVAQAARIVAACGQAALHADFNRAANPARSAATVENAAAAITTIAVAIERVGSSTAAVIEAAAVIQARFAMTTLADNLASGTWASGGDTDEQRRARAQRMRQTVTRDLQLLPPAPDTTVG